MTTTDLQMPISGQANALGNAILTTGPSQVNTTWTVSQVTVNATPKNQVPGVCGAAVYLNQVLVCATIAGQQDSAAGDPPITVQAGAQIEIQWSGCLPGTAVTALLIGTQDYPG